MNLESVVKNKLCVSCGACTQIDELNVVMKEKRSGIYEPIVTDQSNSNFDDLFSFICPGVGYDIERMAEEKFEDGDIKVPELGRFKRIGAAYARSEELLKNASSGGVMTSVALYLINSGIVDGVIVTKMVGSRTKTYVARSESELIAAQGSKYCPVPSLDLEIEAVDYKNGLAFIGTPCQVAALEALKKAGQKKSEWVNSVKLTLANFCGGFRDLRETDLLIQRAGFDPKRIDYLQYRGGGQPGEMLIKQDDLVKRLPYPDYARGTGIVKHKRCRYCVDATGELADISFGDAWIPRFLSSNNAWSLFIARSSYGDELLKRMTSESFLEEKPVEIEELIASQIGNIATKKYRQSARYLLAKLLRVKTPNFNETRFDKVSSLAFEIKVNLSHTAFSILEKLGVYPLVAKLIKRYPEDLK